MKFKNGFESKLMTRFINDHTLLIEPTDLAVCEMCGKKEELRPYGPKGENVCIGCGMKDEAAMERAFGQILGGRQ